MGHVGKGQSHRKEVGMSGRAAAGRGGPGWGARQRVVAAGWDLVLRVGAEGLWTSRGCRHSWALSDRPGLPVQPWPQDRVPAH